MNNFIKYGYDEADNLEYNRLRISDFKFKLNFK